MYLNLIIIPLIPHLFHLFPLLVTLINKGPVMLFIFHLTLVDLFGVLLVFLGGFLLEVSPLVQHLVQLGLEAIALYLLLFEGVQGVRKLDAEFRDLVVTRVQDRTLLLTQGRDEAVVALGTVL